MNSLHDLLRRLTDSRPFSETEKLVAEGIIAEHEEASAPAPAPDAGIEGIEVPADQNTVNAEAPAPPAS